jgi:hypothetical protein
MTAGVSNSDPWLVYTHQDGSFSLLATDLPDAQLVDQPSCFLEQVPNTWQVRASLRTDLNHDGEPECTLLVWRPWEDWPIMRWSDAPSPITDNHDTQGDSSHVILIDPSNHRELWAGSALALPILQIAAGDIDGDGATELVALEGDYVSGRSGPARHVAVWRWNGFGFNLASRSPFRRLNALQLLDLEGDGVAEIVVR